MQIVCKSCITPEQIEARRHLNIPYELQLYNDFKTSSVSELVSVVKQSGVDVLLVHSPLFADGAGNIEYLKGLRVREGIENTLALAGELSEYFKHKITVVLHLGVSSVLVCATDMYQVISDLLFCYLRKYPLLDVAFENVMPFDKGRFYANVFDESLYFIDQLNAEFYCAEKRIGTVLDVCHAIGTIRAIKAISGDCRLTVDDYFEVNMRYVKAVHLADCNGMGYNREDHGVPFKEKSEMMEYMNSYYKWAYSCPIVIEVREEDYLNPTNLINNYNMLKEVIGI